MLQFRSLLLAFLATLWVCGASRAATTGPDADPFPGPRDAFWTKNGKAITFPLLVGKNYQWLITKVYYANDKLQDTHVKDSKGNLHGHWHVQDDYPAAKNHFTAQENNQNKYLESANAYWNYKFQGGKEGDPYLFEDATTQKNCFTYALHACIGRGTYNYWIDDQYNTVVKGLGDIGEMTAALMADAYTVPKKDVISHDVLLYNKNVHATGVGSINCGDPRTPKTLHWKYQGSGYYSFTANSFNTPMYIFDDPLPSNPLPAGTWKLDGAGNENGLTPAGMVWRTNPLGK
jgi:hypothetical protein